jgi:alpha-mannosidase
MGARTMARFSGLALLMLLAIPTTSAQTTTVWQVGRFDHSTEEFRAAPSEHVVYQAGKSNSGSDWPATQNTGSGYEIQFTLSNAPRGAFVLKVSLFAYSLKIPALQVDVNGHKGLFYLHPEVKYAVLDPHPPPSQVLSIEIPDRYLRKGSNSLILSCVDSQSSGTEAKGISGIRYDALSLTNDPESPNTGKSIRVEITPTIYYQQKEGELVELVDVFLRFERPAAAGSAVLVIGGKSYRAAIAAVKNFGEERLQFEVPEWTGTVQATLKVAAGQRTTVVLPLTAARKWTVFVVPHTHVDIGYTDYQGKVAEIHARTLQEAASFIQEHPDFRFATDGSWNVQQFLATRSKELQDELVRLAQQDKIGIPADYANLLTGYASLETLYRSLYYSKWLSRTNRIPFDYATTTDVPTYTGAYPSVLASAGIKYWAVGGNNDRAPVLSHERWDEKSPFWWEGPDGEKVLFWYSRGYAQIGSTFGLPPQLAAGYDTLPVFLQTYSNKTYKPDAVLMYGAQAENTDLHPELAEFATDWDRNYAYPKLQYATFADFFRYIDKNFGSELSTYRGDMGPYWEDGVGADAYYTAEDRENQSLALSAEITASVSHSVSPDLHPPKAELDDAWRNIELFAEHTWTAGNSISQPDTDEVVKQLAVKDNRATQARFDVDDVAQRAMEQLADQIHIPAGTLVVFNALNWKRDALVETDLGEHEELVDMTTGQTVPTEIVSKKEDFAHVRFLAADLPPVGYKCFQIRSAANSISVEPQVDKDPVIQNRYYRVTVDPESGALRSIFDKQLQRELVDVHSRYKFGQYLYVTGGDGNTRMIRPIEALPLAKLTIHPAENGEYLGTQKTPWGYSIRLRSSDVNTPAIELEILLFNDRKRIEFRYGVQKQYTTAKEGVYFAFPIAVAPPRFAFTNQQEWIDPAKDILKGGSLEWFTIQQWMAAYDSGAAVGIVPVDAPLASFGDINRGEWPAEFHPKTSTIFSYVMNNYWHTNYPAGQGGTFNFNYVMTSGDHLDPAALTRLGWESMEPVELDHVIHNDKIDDPERPLPAQGTSFLQIDAPNVVLIDWKLAEDGNGSILRLEETAGQATKATIRLPHAYVQSASLCDSVEDNLHALQVDDNEVQVSFNPHEVLTVRLKLTPER